MIEDLDVMSTVIDVVVYGGGAVMLGLVAKLFLSDFPRIEKENSEKLYGLQDSYSENMGRDELVNMYHDALSFSFLPKERRGERRKLVGKIEGQLQQYIRDEVKASVGNVTFDRHTPTDGLCERLSPTYQATFGRERERQRRMNSY